VSDPKRRAHVVRYREYGTRRYGVAYPYGDDLWITMGEINNYMTRDQAREHVREWLRYGREAAAQEANRV